MKSLIDIVPEDWDSDKLKILAKTYSGGTPLRSNEAYYGGPIKWVKSSELKKKYLYDTEETITELAIEKTSARMVEANTILMAMYGATAGDTCILKVKASLNQAVLAISVDQEVDREYLYYFLKYKAEKLKFVTQGGGQPNLSKGIIDSLFISRPNYKPEQTAISTILTKVDEAIEATENSIKAAEKLKKALMQNLLTGKLKPDGTWRTEDEFDEDEKFGKYPKDWSLSRFKDFSVLQRGKDLTDNEVIPGSHPVVKSNGIQIWHSENFVEPPGVITGRSGTIGKVFFVEKKFWAHNTTLYVKDFKGNDPKYIFYLIQRMDFRQYYAGTTVPTLNRNDIHRLKISIPKSVDEQIAISRKLDSVVEIIKSKRKKIQKLQKLKKALMQNLLTGKVRLSPDLIEKLAGQEKEVIFG